MERDSIIYILEKIGAEKISVVGDKEVYACCPFAKYGSKGHKNNVDKTPSFTIRIDEFGESPYRCFGCNIKGKCLSTFVAHLIKLDPKFMELKELVDEEILANVVRKMDKVHKKFDKIEDARINKMVRPESEFDPFAGKAPDYTFLPKPHGCGLTKEMAETWMIGGDDFSKRVVFPVREGNGGLVGMVGRTTVNDATKYFNYWNFKKGEFLYGENFIDPENPPEEVVIVEGITDTIIGNSHVEGLPIRVLGIFGAHASETQINKVLGLGCTNVHIMLDGDEAGAKGSEELYHHMDNRVKFLNKVILPNKRDPGDISREDFLRYIGKTA